MASIKAKINFIDNQKQQSFISILVPINITPRLTNAFSPPFPNFTPIFSDVTLDSANAFSSTFLIYQSTITLKVAQISSIPSVDLLQQLLNAFANLYIQIPPIKVSNKMLSIIIIAQFVNI